MELFAAGLTPPAQWESVPPVDRAPFRVAARAVWEGQAGTSGPGHRGVGGRPGPARSEHSPGYGRR